MIRLGHKSVRKRSVPSRRRTRNQLLRKPSGLQQILQSFCCTVYQVVLLKSKQINVLYRVLYQVPGRSTQMSRLSQLLSLSKSASASHLKSISSLTSHISVVSLLLASSGDRIRHRLLSAHTFSLSSSNNRAQYW